MGAALEDRFIGCLLGLAVGDALGAHFEARTPEGIAQLYQTPRALLEHPPYGEYWYTDDTQMAIGVAEALVACRQIFEQDLLVRFAKNYQTYRGYGRGTKYILEAVIAGDDHKLLAETMFPGGSFGNGAAMRVAPIGLAFRGDKEALLRQAKLSALPTHTHPLAIEGAQLLALAVALASATDKFEKAAFFDELLSIQSGPEFAGPLRRAQDVTDRRDLALLGNGIAATDSVVTAIASFAMTPHDYGSTVANLIVLGGDTDTLAAMAGAISGAYLGKSAIPDHLVDKLENDQKGRRYIVELAKEMHRLFA